MSLSSLYKNANIWAVAIFLLAAYLALVNLDYVTLWHDEGTNAIMARNFLNTGTFTGWDGRNLYVGANGSGINNQLIMASYPPWPAVLSALGMAVFGENEIGMRFFHAVWGLLSLFFFWRLLNLDFASAPRLRVIAFALFALSAQMLLFMRQGRYYPDALFFVLASFYYYRLYVSENGRLWHLALMAGLTVLNFLNHFALGASTALSFAAWHILYYRHQTSWQQWLRLTAFGAAAASICMLYLWGVGIIGSDEQLEYGADTYRYAWFPRHMYLLYYYLRDMVQYAWLPFWVAVWMVYFVFQYYTKVKTSTVKKRRKKKGSQNTSIKVMDVDKHIIRWMVLALLSIVMAALLSIQPATHQIADSRYLLGAYPFLALIVAACVDWLWKRHKGNVYAFILLMLLLLSNLPGYPFLHAGILIREKIKWPLPSLIREIHRPYPSAIREVVAYLNQHIKQDDFIYVSPWQEQVLLHFYLGDKLIFCCLLDGKDNLPKNTIKNLGVPLYRGDIKPTWLVTNSEEDFKGYELVYRSESFYYPAQRPEIEYRSFVPLQSEHKLAVYRLKQKER